MSSARTHAVVLRNKGDVMSLFWIGLLVGMGITVSYLSIRQSGLGLGPVLLGDGPAMRLSHPQWTHRSLSAVGVTTLCASLLVLLSSGYVTLPAPPAPASAKVDIATVSTQADGDIARMQSYVAAIERVTTGERTTQATTPAGGLPDVETMIGELERRLLASSGDVEGWRTLGWSYFNTNRPGKAVAAYERALAMAPDRSDIREALEAAKTAAVVNVAAPDKTGGGAAD